MGQKYVPSIKDLKAGRRFQQKQHVQSKFIKPAAKPPTPKPADPKASRKDGMWKSGSGPETQTSIF